MGLILQKGVAAQVVFHLVVVAGGRVFNQLRGTKTQNNYNFKLIALKLYQRLDGNFFSLRCNIARIKFPIHKKKRKTYKITTVKPITDKITCVFSL